MSSAAALLFPSPRTSAQRRQEAILAERGLGRAALAFADHLDPFWRQAYEAVLGRLRGRLAQEPARSGR